MTPIQFLITHRDMDSSRKDLAQALLDVGRQYGAAREFNREDLVRWFAAGEKRPRWFHQAALDIALEHGWRVDTREAADAAIATLRSRHADLSLTQLKSMLGEAVVDARMLDDAWLSVTLSKKVSA